MKKLWMLIVLVMVFTSGCSSNESETALNPDKPITIRVWHYYNGSTQEIFEQLVNEFNDTVGMEEGIVIESQSQGSVDQLATAIFEAASENIGSQPLPEIFATYADNAFRIRDLVDLVSLDKLFTESELSLYRQEFLDEGYFITDGMSYIMPVAKSFENLYISKTDWEPFAAAHNLSTNDLSTWEGINEVAALYHDVTGKAFFGLDSSANFFIVGTKQLGQDIYQYNDDGTATFNLSKENARRFWDCFAVPYLKGNYAKTGRFSSDDAKTGKILAYTGSTAGAAYFPSVVSLSETESYDIEPLVLPYPYFENGDKVVIQQGAGMCVVNTDDAHNSGAKLFLEWFTRPEQNLRFSVETGYFPVQESALEKTAILKELQKENNPLPAVVGAIEASNIMLNEYQLHNMKAFEGSFETRVLMDKYIYAYMNQVLENLALKADDASSYKDALNDAVSEKAFNQWYDDLVKQVNNIIQ
ncbi:MAG: extracellular solute-binding protein [Clostridia bacterium]|nr:extracellular solute-binding protein [Clostridia bacterium]